jgi:wyosine [tRNA(Phe)-imidazoG37] synthetase (radical SAM superfamily)
MSDAPPTFVPIFTQHSRHWRDNRYVYPVVSRRSKGLSIGVNLNPDKVCNFDCLYCCVDRTTMPGRVEVDLAVLRDELAYLLELARSGEIWKHPPFDTTPPALRRLNDVAFSGDGEPTSFPRFEDACRLAATLLDERSLNDVKIVVITNATLFHQPRVRQALQYLDEHRGELWAKLDAGTEGYFQLVERSSIPFARVLANLLDAARARPIVIQTLFMNVHGTPPDDAEIAAYIERLRDLVSGGGQVKLVQVYTIARDTAETFVAPLPRESLDAISQRVRDATGLTVETYYGPC